MKKLFTLIILSLIILSCEKEKMPLPSTPFNSESGGVFISNEGNFQSGNGTLVYYNPSTEAVISNEYENTNHNSLGDICQSMNLINGKLFVVVNNSGKIEVCNPNSLQHLSTITGLTSPRYIIQAGTSKAYVSDTYSNTVSVINLDNNTVTSTIPIPGWTEQMLKINNKIYVTDVYSAYLYVIDPTNDIVSDSIHISKGAGWIVGDKNGKIWVLCGGDYLQTYNGALFRIDPSTNQIELSISFPANDFPSRLCINGTGDMLYYLNNGIFRMGLNDTSFPLSTFIPSVSNSFYGLGVNPVNNEIFVSDAIDYIQRGKVIRYDGNGMQLSKITAGIIPGDFLLLP